MICVGYVRVSSEEQKKKGYSIEGQKKEIESRAELDGEIINKWYADEGFSGTSIKRSGLRKLLLDCSQNKIDRIYIVDSDRLTRKPIHRFSIGEVFKKYNVEVISSVEDWNTDTLQGQLTGDIKTLIAFHEVLQVRTRTVRGLSESARQGNYAKSNCPRGYKKVLNEKSKVENGRKLEIIPEWENIIFEIFSSIANRTKSVSGLAKEYDEKMVGGKHWNDDVIHAIIKNPIYKGTFVSSFAYYENHQPAFVSSELWEKANLSLDCFSRDRKYYYIFGELVYCVDCGTWARKDVTIKYTKSFKGINNANRYKYSECPICRKRINEDKLKLDVMLELAKKIEKDDEKDKLIQIYDKEIEKNNLKLKLLENEFDEGLLSEEEYRETRKKILLKIKQTKKKKEKPFSKTKIYLEPLDALEFRMLFLKFFSHIEYSFENKMIVRLVEKKREKSLDF